MKRVVLPRARASVPGQSSPSLSISNNSNDGALDIEQCTINKLTGGHRRMAWVISKEIERMAKLYGVEKIGFITFTFGDHVVKIKEAQRRFNSLSTAVLRERYICGIVVVERFKSSRVHFHLVVALRADIQSGVDFVAFMREDYRSAGPALRAEWAFWRKTCPKYGFGRHELLPVKSTAEGIARYMGKYVSKGVQNRMQADKGARIVRFMGFKPQDRQFYTGFAWNTPNGWLWRHKLAAWCNGQDIETLDQLKQLFGRRWAYLLQDEIMATRVHEVLPDLATAKRSSELTFAADVKRDLVEAEKARRAPGARVYQLNEGDRFKRVKLQRLEVGGSVVFKIRQKV